MAEKLASEESLATVLELRPLPQRPARDRARRQALTFFKQNLPLFLEVMRRR
ncbi:hypothetical protein [Phenylobacterium soli]|uniref:hypothetical protein n=1 Tax=Phenylobacterium soli TaxID=2170551 RepID=UPI00140302B8|nr:hypothetical protein [Phenylobacterium soli]